MLHLMHATSIAINLYLIAVSCSSMYAESVPSAYRIVPSSSIEIPIWTDCRRGKWTNDERGMDNIVTRFWFRRAGVLSRVLKLRGGTNARSDVEGQQQGDGQDTEVQHPTVEGAGYIPGSGFPTLSAKNGEALEVSSLCMSCGAEGITRILPSTIPRFGQVVIMAFECNECNYTSNNVQNAADIKPFGVEFILSIANRDDLDRQVIKSAHATIRIPDMDFEIPPVTQSGSLSTVEGVLMHAAKSLEYMQVTCDKSP